MVTAVYSVTSPIGLCCWENSLRFIFMHNFKISVFDAVFYRIDSDGSQDRELQKRPRFRDKHEILQQCTCFFKPPPDHGFKLPSSSVTWWPSELSPSKMQLVLGGPAGSANSPENALLMPVHNSQKMRWWDMGNTPAFCDHDGLTFVDEDAQDGGAVQGALRLSGWYVVKSLLLFFMWNHMSKCYIDVIFYFVR